MQDEGRGRYGQGRYDGSIQQGNSGAGGTSLGTANNPSGLQGSAGSGGGGGGIPWGFPPSTHPLPPNVVPPPPGTVPVGGVTAGGAAGAGGSIANTIRNLFTTPGGIAQLGGILTALMGSGAFSGGGGGSQEIPQEMRDAMAMTNARFRRTDPLHEAVTQLAFQRMPTYSRDGITMNRVPLPGGDQ